MRAGDLVRLFQPSTQHSKAQILRDVLLPPIKTAIVCVAVCAWDVYHELVHVAECSNARSWRTASLFVPHLLLVIAYAILVAITVHYRRSLHRMLSIIVLVLLPTSWVAVVVTVFRTSITLCCCMPLFCPMTSPKQPPPNTKACSQVFDNCYWGLVRKVAHYLATVGLLYPLLSLIFATLHASSRHRLASIHMSRFIAKVRKLQPGLQPKTE